MKATLLLAGTTLLAASALAQPVLDHSFLPQAGVTVVLGGNDFAGVPPGSSGANQSWDFSTLPQTFEETFIFMDPSETPFQDSFPTANLAAQQPDTSFAFYHVSTRELNALGFAKDQPGFGIFESDFSFDPERILTLPFAYQDTDNDTFEGVQGALGFYVEVTGTHAVEADAWGTLTLPNGTYMNTIRLREERSQTSSGFTFESVVYRWISPDHVFWLFELGENSNTGGVTDHLNRWALDPHTVGVETISTENTGFNVLNTVVHSGAPIRIWAWEPVMGSLTFTDMNGRVITTLDRTTLGREGDHLCQQRQGGDHTSSDPVTAVQIIAQVYRRS